MQGTPHARCLHAQLLREDIVEPSGKGFVVVAQANGTTHPKRNSWSSGLNTPRSFSGSIPSRLCDGVREAGVPEGPTKKVQNQGASNAFRGMLHGIDERSVRISNVAGRATKPMGDKRSATIGSLVSVGAMSPSLWHLRKIEMPVIEMRWGSILSKQVLHNGTTPSPKYSSRRSCLPYCSPCCRLYFRP